MFTFRLDLFSAEISTRNCKIYSDELPFYRDDFENLYVGIGGRTFVVCLSLELDELLIVPDELLRERMN